MSFRFGSDEMGGFIVHYTPDRRGPVLILLMVVVISRFWGSVRDRGERAA